LGHRESLAVVLELLLELFNSAAALASSCCQRLLALIGNMMPRTSNVRSMMQMP